MKIILKYQAPETHLDAYKFSAVYDETEISEAVEELQAAKRYGYEITMWTLVHDEDVESVL
jgi:hypothetical protein